MLAKNGTHWDLQLRQGTRHDVGRGQAPARHAVALHIGGVQTERQAIKAVRVFQHERHQVVAVHLVLCFGRGQMPPAFERHPLRCGHAHARRAHQHQLLSILRVRGQPQSARHAAKRKAHQLHPIATGTTGLQLLQTGMQMGGQSVHIGTAGR